MVSKKHLVLDDDVYLKLNRRKARTKLAAKTIGNSILRSVLSRPHLPDVIGQRLIKMEKVTPEEYERVLEESKREVEKVPTHVSEIIDTTDQRTFTAGSWQFQERWRSSDAAIAVVECWARDGKCTPMKSHYHAESEFLIVTRGRVQVQTEEQTEVLDVGESFSLSAGHIHSNGPLSDDARMFVITVPALPDLAPTHSE